ncbi:VWA domain-containing protein [Dactylosporangium sp. NPDC005555]|uniref:vWA domain-containing protein n=1 Tax=Dactylosporangium sp. NPDC005555 TaxID=3154889 RepID=UPI0033B0F265
MDHTGAKLLPFYLVIDVSWSMTQDHKLDAANRIVPALVDALARNPVLSDRVRFGLIDFADEARVRLPLCDLLAPGLQLPVLAAHGGGTSFAGAFTVLRREIEADVARLKADRYVVHRPAVWFISDGEPTDRGTIWRQAFEDLVSSPAFPNLVPCGVDRADLGVMGSLIHPSTGPKRMSLYMMEPDFSPAAAITGMQEILVSSMIQSGYGLANGGTGTILPARTALPAGIRQYDPADFV